MRTRLIVLLVTTVVVALAITVGPRAPSLVHGQDQAKVETFQSVLDRLDGINIQLWGVPGEAVIAPTGRLHTRNRPGYVVFITRGTDRFVIPHTAIAYVREQPSSPLTPNALHGPPMIQLIMNQRLER
jgi:hypothetical protein